jgi:hypothetical protein
MFLLTIHVLCDFVQDVQPSLDACSFHFWLSLDHYHPPIITIIIIIIIVIIIINHHHHWSQSHSYCLLQQKLTLLPFIMQLLPMHPFVSPPSPFLMWKPLLLSNKRLLLPHPLIPSSDNDDDDGVSTASIPALTSSYLQSSSSMMATIAAAVRQVTMNSCRLYDLMPPLSLPLFCTPPSITLLLCSDKKTVMICHNY